MNFETDINDKANAFGERLKTLRGEIRLQDVANALGISRASLGYYENGDRKPDIEVLMKLAKYYKVSCDYILGFTNLSSPDIEDQAIYEKTGLSEKSIEVLKTEKSLNHLYVVEVINILLNDCWTNPESRNTKYSFIRLFTNYLNFCVNGIRRYSLSKSGNIKMEPIPDMMDMDGKAKYSEADIYFTSEQLEKMYIMEIEDILKALKESYIIQKKKAPETN